MTKTITNDLATHLDQEVTSLATIWRLVRSDGVTFYFTDHDEDIEFESNVYESAVGYNPTSISNKVGLAVDELDVFGYLDSSALTERELRAGLYDFAEIFVALINWQDTSQGLMQMRRGRIGEVILTNTGAFKAELRGLTQAYSQNIVELYQGQCRADLGDGRCQVPIDVEEIQRSTAYAEGDRVRVRTTGTLPSSPLGLINGDFEDNGGQVTAPPGTIIGWSLVGPGVWDVHTEAGGLGNLPPYSGLHYLEGGAASGTSRLAQTVDLLVQGFDAGKIDNGDYTFTSSVWRANSYPLDRGRILIEFLDAANAVISEAQDTGLEEITPEDTWVERRVDDVPIPALTRKIRYTLFAELVDGSQANASFDAITAFVTDLTVMVAAPGDFENRYYVCTVAGTTDMMQPVYDTTVGNPTTDGTAVFEAVESWTRSATVSAVTDQRVFEITIDEARAVDNWFNYGAVTFYSGENAGISMEVKDWTQATNTVELFLDLPFPIAETDILEIYPGCDKTLPICTAKFGNVINYRGEPYVPGQGEFLAGPEAR